MSLRRLLVLAAAAALVIACGDDSGSTSDADASPADDTAAMDAGEDTAAATDTAPTPQDTSVTTPDTSQPPQDTSAPQDTTPVDLGQGTCPGMRACVAGCAGDADCEAACLDAADSTAESDAYAALEACLTDKGCDESAASDDDKQNLYECYRQCLPEIATCAAGTFGDGTCVDVSGCISSNCFGEGDFRCERACMSQADQAAVEHYLDWDYCSLSECYNSTDIIAMENCIQQVRNEVVCSDPYSECFATTGAGTGAGAGGGR